MVTKKELTNLAINWNADNLMKVVDGISYKEFISVFDILDKDKTKDLVGMRNSNFGKEFGGKSFMGLALDGDIDVGWLFILDIPYLISTTKIYKDIRMIEWVVKNSREWLRMRDSLVEVRGYKADYERWGFDNTTTCIDTRRFVMRVLEVCFNEGNRPDVLKLIEGGLLNYLDEYSYSNMLEVVKGLMYDFELEMRLSCIKGSHIYITKECNYLEEMVKAKESPDNPYSTKSSEWRFLNMLYEYARLGIKSNFMDKIRRDSLHFDATTLYMLKNWYRIMEHRGVKGGA